MLMDELPLISVAATYTIKDNKNRAFFCMALSCGSMIFSKGGGPCLPFLFQGAPLITIDISSNIESIEEYLDDAKKSAVVSAARGAINKTLRTARTKSADLIGQRYNLKKKDIRGPMKIKRARGSTLSKLEGILFYGDKKHGIIKFVKGSKSVIKQKGIKIRRRRKLKAEIIKGKKITLKKAFIQRADTKQVFKGRRGDGFKTQAIASNAVIMLRSKNEIKLMKVVKQRFETVLAQELNFRLSKLAQRQRSRRMKKI